MQANRKHAGTYKLHDGSQHAQINQEKNLTYKTIKKMTKTFKK